MTHEKCIFCKIISSEIPSTKITENEDVLVIKDIAPKAPIHYLIIPKKHVIDVASLEENDASIASKMIFMAKTLSTDLPDEQSFRLIINNGPQAGQTVFHLHCHFIAGKKMTDF